MKTFNMYLDQKITTWMRTEFEVEAETIEEAKKLAIEKFNNGDLLEIPWQEVDSCQEVMTVEENGGFSTAEIYYVDDEAMGMDEFYSNKTNLEY
jgi:predicted esterase YcpF (UPF0227 family)